MNNIIGRPLNFFVLNGATPSGLTIGKLGDEAIYEFVADQFGYRYRYVGLASRTWSGEINVEALRPGEFILPPGLVYRRLERIRERDTSGRIARFLASLFASKDRSSHAEH